METILKSKIAVAIDHLTLQEAESFLEKNAPHLGTIKIGLELFLLGGPEWIRKLEKYSLNIFLDLKLYDIPNTVFQAIKSLQGLKINYLTLHLLGGRSMLQKAIVARDLYLPQTKLLGVSLLTSYDDQEIQNDLLINDKTFYFNHLFKMAFELKIDGVVHSGEELSLASHYPFISVCPGIRFSDELEHFTHDQKRIYTPQEVLKYLNKDKEILIVMGRSILRCMKANFELDHELVNAKLHIPV
jgi:orotidine-5'-phosphate decarboxylase